MFATAVVIPHLFVISRDKDGETAIHSVKELRSPTNRIYNCSNKVTFNFTPILF